MSNIYSNVIINTIITIIILLPILYKYLFEIKDINIISIINLFILYFINSLNIIIYGYLYGNKKRYRKLIIDNKKPIKLRNRIEVPILYLKSYRIYRSYTFINCDYNTGWNRLFGIKMGNDSYFFSFRYNNNKIIVSHSIILDNFRIDKYNDMYVNLDLNLEYYFLIEYDTVLGSIIFKIYYNDHLLHHSIEKIHNFHIFGKKLETILNYDIKPELKVRYLNLK